MPDAKCGRIGWPEPDQDGDNPCVCDEPAGHGGLHLCWSCGSEWAGGRKSSDSR